MTQAIKHVGLGLWLLAVALGAAAQDKVYRCGPDGRSYSAQPCPEGREVPVADPRDAGQRREAAHTARREAALADQLARERSARERSARGQKAATLGAAKPPEPAASAPKKRKPPKTVKLRRDSGDALRGPAKPPG